MAVNDFCTIEEALAELRAGRMIVLVDDEHRENEGDLIIPAEKAAPEAINFMMRNGCGIVCLADVARPSASGCTSNRCRRAAVDPQSTPFTQSIDARTGITTGTSAFDRARTVPVAIDDDFRARRPGARQGPRLRPAGPRRRRPGPGRPHRRQRRPGPIGRLQGSGRHLRGRPPRRPHGPPAGPADLLPAARPEDVHHRGPDQVSPPPRKADPPGARRQAADPARRIRPDSPTPRWSIRSRTWPCAWAASASRSTARCRCRPSRSWCASTANV